MKGIKFKSFEEYAKYIEKNASGKVQETKAKASSKKKKENYATKTNVGKAGNTLKDVTTFSGYRCSAKQLKRRERSSTRMGFSIILTLSRNFTAMGIM